MEEYSCVQIEAEDGEDFQQYVSEDGSTIKAGTVVGVEITQGGKTTFYMLDDIWFKN